jgi:hypothetical protein
VTIDQANASVAELTARKSLNATLRNGSYLTYHGNPAVTDKLSNASGFQQANDAPTRNN